MTEVATGTATAQIEPLRSIRRKDSEMLRHCATLRTRLIASALLVAGVNLSVQAQTSVPAAAASAPDYSGVRYGPMQKLRCSDGEYRGPEPGKKVWTQDPYTWAVSRDFAKRFCMPESMVSDELVGAEAVAYRVKPSDEATCRAEGGQEVCRRKAELEIEVYLRSDLGLPRSHPEVRFYQVPRSERSSGLHIETNQAQRNADRRRAGVWSDPPGRVAPFHVFAGADESRRVRFIYLDLGQNDNRKAALYGDFIETHFQSNWVDGIDLVRLGAGPSISVGIVDSPGLSKFGIGVIRGKDMPRGGVEETWKMTRGQYAHIIELPAAIPERIYAYGKQQGDLLINSAKRALGVPGTPSLPKNAEPLVPPVNR